MSPLKDRYVCSISAMRRRACSSEAAICGCQGGKREKRGKRLLAVGVQRERLECLLGDSTNAGQKTLWVGVQGVIYISHESLYAGCSKLSGKGKNFFFLLLA